MRFWTLAAQPPIDTVSANDKVMARIVVNGVSRTLVVWGLALLPVGVLVMTWDDQLGPRVSRFVGIAVLCVGMGCIGLAFESQDFAVLSQKGVRDLMGLIRWKGVTNATLVAIDGRHYLQLIMPAAKYPGRLPPRYDGYEPLERTSWQFELTDSVQRLPDLPHLLRSWIGDAFAVGQSQERPER